MTDQKTAAAEEGIDEKIIPADQGNEGESVTPKNDPVEEDIVPTDIPVRAQSHIIARQKRTIEKLRSKVDDNADADYEEEGDNGSNQIDNSEIDRRVKQNLEPVMQELARNADASELRELIHSIPDAKRYEKRIKGYMEKWGNTPAEAIYHYLARQDDMKTQAKTKADKVAAHSGNAGSSHRPSVAPAQGEMPTAEEIDTMSKEEFETLQADVNAGKYLK